MSNEGKPSCSEDLRIGGIEGGGTHSTIIIMNGKGELLTQLSGPGTNQWELGIKETANCINGMISRAKKEINMSECRQLDCVGLYLSGCGDDVTGRKLQETLTQEFPAASKEYVIGIDTLCSLSTGVATGGLILIAGTGSNSLLLNPDGKIFNCGGWGYMLGDEGSAYWMAHRAFKYVFDDIDGLIAAPHPTTYVWSAMKDHFKVTNQHEFLICMYSNFEKSKIAKFTMELVAGCRVGDPFCRHIFEESGRYLAKHVNALAKNAHNDIKFCPGGLKVICIGSVWKSWEFLKKGFLQEIDECRVLDELTLAKLTVSSAVGACYRAGDKINCNELKKNYEKNVEIFFHYKRDDVALNRVTDGAARKIAEQV